MIEQIKEVLSYGSPKEWAKTQDNIAKVRNIERVWREVFNNKTDHCSFCARTEMYNHLVKYLKGHGHL